MGVYGADAPPLTLSITREGALLFAESPGNLARDEIVFTTDDVAIALGSGMRFTFGRGPDGGVTQVEVAGLTLARR